MRRFWTLTTASMGIMLALPTAAQVRVPGPGYRPAPAANYAAPIPAPQNFAAHPAPRTIAAQPYQAMPNRNGQVWQNGRWSAMPGNHGPVGRSNPNRWGGKINGHWYAGMQAPGGWNAYRPMHRGGRLPRYWMSPNFFIGDYLAWGLASPPYGYHWARYYDDAVLVDDNGSVWDSYGGIGWDGDDVATANSEAYAWSSTDDAGADYPPPQEYTRGGSVPPAVVYAPPAAQVQPVPQDYAEGFVDNGYAARYGYNSGGASVTVINIPAAPTVTTTTTTTTEIVEDRTYHTVRHVYRPVRRRVAPVCCPCRCR